MHIGLEMGRRLRGERKMNFNNSKYPMIVYFFYDNLRLFRNYFFKRIPIRRSAEDLSCTPFFIIGSARSGTTLLRSILSGHPNICIPPESQVIHKLVRSYQYLNFLPWEHLSRLIISQFEARKKFYLWEIDMSKFYSELVALKEKNRSLAKAVDMFYCYYMKEKKPACRMWGDKTTLNTLHLEWINRLFPEAKFVNIIRDGRGAVSSMLKTGTYNKIEDACQRWSKSIKLAQKFAETKENNFINVRYENLTSHPESEVKKVCAFLSVDYRPEMLEFHNSLLADTKQRHHSNLRKPINTSSIEKWKKNSSAEQKVLVDKLLHNNLVKLGYK